LTGGGASFALSNPTHDGVVDVGLGHGEGDVGLHAAGLDVPLGRAVVTA
jgi:hypothetical protein